MRLMQSIQNKSKYPLILTLLMVILSACAVDVGASGHELNVLAASSLTDALNEIAAAYEANTPGTHIKLNYASSSILAAQILEGARADVFASANTEQMENLVKSGLIHGDIDYFASNRMTAIVPAENPAKIISITDLAKPGTALVLALPGVPARVYTDQFVNQVISDPAFGANFRASFYSNVVSEEANVRRVVAKVALGEADGGIVYLSDITPDMKDSVRQIPIPNEYNPVARYPIAVLDNAQDSEIAQGFIDFILSREGQAILKKWGFGAKP